MNELDAQLINRIQENFPLASRPYQELAQELGVTEEEVLGCVKALKEEGIIRHLGPVFDSNKLGFHSTLAAIQVPENRLEEVAQIINAYPGVTHNYLRNMEYNMWFTLTAESEQRVEDILDEISQKTGINKLLNLPAINLFKIKVKFKI